jgi:hypothetical protein
MEENLAGYLLNALDVETHEQVKHHLQANPEAQRQLETIRQTLHLLEADREDPEPPHGLKYAALAHIAEYRCRTLPKAPKPLPSQVVSKRSWWRRADVAIAAALMLTITGVGLPGIASLWRQARIAACKDNLRRWHASLAGYSDTHHGDFPRIEADPPFNFAGAYVPILHDGGTLPGDISVGCPGNGLNQPSPLTLQELVAMQSTEEGRRHYQDVVKKIGGCYAYSLGYQDNADGTPHHFGLRCDSGDRLPIMSDKPPYSDGACPLGNSSNHGGTGQNVLFIGGNVNYYPTRYVGMGGDDIFSNKHNKMAAGFGLSDSVLGPSQARTYSADGD